MRSAFAALALIAVGACASAPTLRYPVPAVTGAERIRVGISSLEVREVNLPLYAGLEAISIEAADGSIVTNDALLWADDPTRAITQGLAVALSSMTRAKVAAEPWPLSDSPDARLEVRFTKALAANDGVFRMAGQYFVSSPFGERREVARSFDVAAPYVVDSPGSIGDALGQATLDLATQIARDGL